MSVNAPTPTRNPFSLPRLEHAGIIALRNFGAWLATVHVVLSISFAKSVEGAAVAAGVTGILDLLTHN